LNAAALICIGLLFRPGVGASRFSYLILSFLWGWMAIVYHFIFFTDINSAAWVFGAVFLLGSAAFALSGVERADVSIQPVPGARAIVGGTLIVFALVLYPLIGYSIGHRYPNAPTFGLPCPTTIFTLGLLLFSVRPIARWLFIVPLLWAAVGSLAAFQLGVIEDLGLLVAGIATIAVMVFSPAPANPLLDANAHGQAARAG
jgi:hypothetical protein